jgi:hypothetical protein
MQKHKLKLRPIRNQISKLMLNHDRRHTPVNHKIPHRRNVVTRKKLKIKFPGREIHRHTAGIDKLVRPLEIPTSGQKQFIRLKNRPNNRQRRKSFLKECGSPWRGEQQARGRAQQQPPARGKYLSLKKTLTKQISDFQNLSTRLRRTLNLKPHTAAGTLSQKQVSQHRLDRGQQLTRGAARLKQQIGEMKGQPGIMPIRRLIKPRLGRILHGQVQITDNRMRTIQT